MSVGGREPCCRATLIMIPPIISMFSSMSIPKDSANNCQCLARKKNFGVIWCMVTKYPVGIFKGFKTAVFFVMSVDKRADSG